MESGEDGEGYVEASGYHVRLPLLFCFIVATDAGRSESLNKVPERLESLIGDRKFLQASVILTRSLKTIDRDEMVEIEALNELRVYLQAQKTVSACAFRGFSSMADSGSG